MRRWTGDRSGGLKPISSAHASENFDELLSLVAVEPVIIMSSGTSRAVVMNSQYYEQLAPKSRKPRVPGTGTEVLVGLDVDMFLTTSLE